MASGNQRRGQVTPNYSPSVPMLGLMGGGGMLGDAPPQNPVDPNKPPMGGGDMPPQFPIDPNPKIPQVGDAPPMYPTDPNSKFGQPVQMDGSGIINGQKKPWYAAMLTKGANTN